jgi:outer membrane protein assembly factor BamB
MLVDGKIYLGDEDGDVVIMQEGKTKKVIAEINMGSSVYSTAVPANGALYISNRNQLYALSEAAGGKPSTTVAAPEAATGKPATAAVKPATPAKP